MTILLFCRRGREFFAGVLVTFGRLRKTSPSGGSVPAKKRAPAGGTVTTSRAQNGDMQFLDGDGLPWGSGFYAWDRAFNVLPRAPCALRRNKNAACKSAAERCAGDCARQPAGDRGCLAFRRFTRSEACGRRGAVYARRRRAEIFHSFTPPAARRP